MSFISALGKYGLGILTIGLMLGAVFFSYAFLQHEKNTPAPLIDIKFFKNKLFLHVNLIQLFFQMIHFGSIFMIGMYLQVGVGMSAVVAGLIMGMQAIGAICVSRYSVKLFHQYGPGIPIIIGLMGVGIITPCILLITIPNMILFGAILLFIRGICSGLCGTPIQTTSILGFEKVDVSRASAVFNAGRQISISLGIALSSLLISYGFKSNGIALSHPILSVSSRVAFYDAFIFTSLIALLGILVTLRLNNKQILLLEQDT